MLKTNTILPILILIVGLSACRKEGCTDEKAENYNEKAKKDDATCTYSGSVVFWLNNTTSVFLQSSNVTYIEVFVNGNKIGGMSTSSSFGAAPNCFEGGVTYQKDLGSSNSNTASYEVKNSSLNPNGPTIYSGTIQVIGGECSSFQIQ